MPHRACPVGHPMQVPTFDSLEESLDGAVSGSMVGLVDISADKRWDHRPRLSDAPPVPNLLQAPARAGGLSAGLDGARALELVVAAACGAALALLASREGRWRPRRQGAGFVPRSAPGAADGAAELREAMLQT